jgi:ectoine hydroxylase-related dioxygenase (phytanoyl-CoA dioxygenase family)
MSNALTESQWQSYQEQGYIKLGKLLSDAELSDMQKRIDDIMLGKADVDYARMMMQLDSETGQYSDVGSHTRGHKGATLNYRKIQELEFDPNFLAYMQRPIFYDLCRRVYGDVPISCFRAMFMNKPARKGTYLPWHQDRWTALDRDPLITMWTALDPATIANGCVQIIPGSHRAGLINPSHDSGFLTNEQAAQHAPESKRVYLELQAGEVALLHNWLLHASDVNKTDIPRRAFSVCYMDGRTRDKKGTLFSTIFGPGALNPNQLRAAAIS